MGLFSKEEPEKLRLPTGKDLSCLICGFDRFFKRQAQLNTPGMTFFKLDWANATGEVHACGRCGFIHWFLDIE